MSTRRDVAQLSVGDEEILFCFVCFFKKERKSFRLKVKLFIVVPVSCNFALTNAKCHLKLHGSCITQLSSHRHPLLLLTWQNSSYAN